jgi:CHASE3 domain sensor protein
MLFRTIRRVLLVLVLVLLLLVLLLSWEKYV